MFQRKTSIYSKPRPLFFGAILILATSMALASLGADSTTGATGIQSRANALMAQMTLDEKIGQMVQVDSGALTDKGDVQKYFLGSVLSGGSSDPADGNRSE